MHNDQNQMHQDKHDIRQDRHEIREDRRDHDYGAAQAERRDMRGDYRQLREEKRDLHADRHARRDHDWDDNYACDEDGDNCHWNSDYGSRYWQNNGGYNYGAPYSWYEGEPPAGANLVQQRAWLINRRQRAMALIAQMRARGDDRGANRVVSIVHALDGRIASINRHLG
jgi:hypothetical protein